MNLNKLLANKKIIIVVSVVVLALILISVLLLNMRNDRTVEAFSELSGLNEEDVLMLSLREGATGEEVVVEEKEQISMLFELVSSLTYIKDRDQKARTGWSYSVDFYKDEKNYTRVLFAGSTVQFQEVSTGVDGSYVVRPGYYYETDRDLSPALELFFAEALLARAKAEAEEDEDDPKPDSVTIKEIYPAIAIVIDNNPHARPSTGLQKADIIYEFLVEGGSTRYLAIYRTLHEENFNIGPIRSLRPYFAVQSLEYGGIVAHSGYSVRTEQMIKGMGIKQIGDTGHFWRDNSRRAPHNLYTNINNLYRAAGDTPRATEIVYRLDEEIEADYKMAELIEIDYAAHNRVSYRYDEEKGVYYRFINGVPHTERETGEQYYADRVIIRKTPHKNVPGPEGLVDIELSGTGEGLLYENGREYAITWENKGRETVFRFSGGQVVEAIPGTTWIQVVR